MVQEAENVRHWLMSNRKISVPDDWLEACIEWIHSESEVTNVLSTVCCTVSKNIPPLTCYKLDIHGSITIIFGKNVTEKVGNANVFG